MVHRLPLVVDPSLRLLDEPSDPIVMGSDASQQYQASEQHQSFDFRNPLGLFTVRRERRCQQWYWYLYHKHEHRRELALRLAGALGQFWIRRSHLI